MLQARPQTFKAAEATEGCHAVILQQINAGSSRTRLLLAELT